VAVSPFPVPALVTRISAPAITAPVVSRTVPVNVPVVLWATRDKTVKVKTQKSLVVEANPLSIVTVTLNQCHHESKVR
jgi:hypothetical protein